MRWYEHIPSRAYWPIGVGVVMVFAITLFLMGRVPWCECGYIKFWHGVVFSSENSQHITDWYTFSHVIHGFAFYGLLWLIGRRWPIGLRLVLAIVLEASWETFENTPFTINRYRAGTISLDYYGDSIINSVGDVFATVFGFVLAHRIPIWATITLAAIMEAFVGYWIRDNLALNIIMLIHPFEAIKIWQMGG